MRPFLPNASDLSVGQKQDEMLKELRVHGPAVWAAYYGPPINCDRIWVVGVPRAEGGLKAKSAESLRRSRKFARFALDDGEL